MITSLVILPLVVEPFLVDELATITVMNRGILAGGPVSPERLVHVPPQLNGFGFVFLANPLKPDGVELPLRELNLGH
jgi:hypothetical protein